MSDAPLLRLDGLGIELRHVTPGRVVVRDVTLEVDAGRTVGLVGESGSGKSMTIKAITRLLPRGTTVGGRAAFQGRDIASMPASDLARYRSRDVAVIPQDPRAAVNPLRTIGDYLLEGVTTTGQMDREAATERALLLLEQMGIPDSARRFHQYPHQLSGGLLQRVVIAAALMPEPKLILADEPTTALDVTVQSDVLAILLERIHEAGSGMLFVTHDLDLAAAITDTLVVMYAGAVVEEGSAHDVYADPRHPYTAGLLASRPSTTHVQRLTPIPGRPVAAFEVSGGCSFAPRCSYADKACHATRPELRVLDGRSVACHRAEELQGRLTEGAAR
jgi:oligopeptide/dipeptide ABC transporter ATP-binding protein